MAHTVARALLLCLLAALGFGLVGGPISGPAPSPCASLWASPTRAQAERVVFVAGNLTPEQLVTLSAGLAAGRHPGVLLLDSPRSGPHHKLFLKHYQPERVVPVGSFPEGVIDLERRLGVRAAPVLDWPDGPPVELWQGLFPRAERVVICPAEPYRLQLQAACLAGAVKAPLYVVPRDGAHRSAKAFRRLLDQWHTHTVFAIGPTTRFCRNLSGVQVKKLPDEEAVCTAYLQHQLKKGPIRNLVVANPADCKRSPLGLSALSPWIAVQKRALLLLTSDAGDNVGAVVKGALKNRDLTQADNLLLVGDLQALPMERRPNPIPNGKDPFIEMEPLTPTGNEPYSFATGRLFNEDPSVVALVLARERLLSAPPRKGTEEARKGEGKCRKALVVSNPTGGLPLLETFSRSTAKELRNRGYETSALFGSEVTKEDLRRLLPEQDIFLWEGHHNTLIKEYALPDWTEPLQPSLVFLQSCLALKDYKAQPLLERGALCVVGSSTRIYSASGGAFALSFFDALLYENRSLGGSLRQAKNFLLTYALLKEKRLGKDARMTAANLRSAWSFTLWGDPTLKLPPPEAPADALPAIRHKVQGNTLHVFLPDLAHEKAATSKYRAQMLPNARLAGLISKDVDDDCHRLVPFIFVEVSLPHAPPGKTPRLRGRVPSSRWVFCWDDRRRCGYLLVTPRAKDRDSLRFHIDWEAPESSVVRRE